MVDDTSVDGETSMGDENVNIRWETPFRARANCGPPICVPLVKEALNRTFNPTMRQLTFSKSLGSLDSRLRYQAAIATDRLRAIAEGTNCGEKAIQVSTQNSHG